MSVGDATIHRSYKCSNETCQAVIAFKQQVKDKWKKVCPFCHKHSLILESGNVDIGTFMDYNKARTIGMVTQENRDRAIKETGKDPCEAKKLPFWRKNRKINYSILKNPEKYVATGEV